ncbi:tetratricopeptide repeat protein [Aliikangiella sp. IMCC44359]|uniref:tetratricopeptide repeat protein n=1 Tax=Aliikangiella sp. IMCC44359 TaxID=3459125 RepID=UPI00403AB526
MKAFLLLIATLLFLPSLDAQVYKWVDESGKIHYSDKPPKKEKTTQLTSIPSANSNQYGVTLGSEKTLKLKRLFKQKAFKQLNVELEQLHNEIKSDIRKEYQVLKIYTAFEFADIKLKPVFDLWIKESPNAFQPYLARAYFYHRLGWNSRGFKYANKTKRSQFKAMRQYFSKAQTDLNKALNFNQKLSNAYCLLIAIKSTVGDKKGGADTLNYALSIIPESYVVRLLYMDFLRPRWGGSYVEMKNFASEAQKYSFKNPMLKLLKGAHWIDQGEIFVSKKQYEKAEQLFTQALSFGEEPQLLFKRGKNYYRLGNYQKAINDLNRAINLLANDEDFYYWRSKVLSKLNNFSAAFDDIQMAYQLNPYEQRINKVRQQLTSAIGVPGTGSIREKEASLKISQINQKLQNQPDEEKLYVKRAKLFFEKKNYIRAEKDLIKLIEIDPQNFEYYLMMDWTLFKQSKLSQILDYWKQYLIYKPNDSRAYYERAGTYGHLQNFSAALDDINRAIDLGHKGAEKLRRKFLKKVNHQ